MPPLLPVVRSSRPACPRPHDAEEEAAGGSGPGGECSAAAALRDHSAGSLWRSRAEWLQTFAQVSMPALRSLLPQPSGRFRGSVACRSEVARDFARLALARTQRVFVAFGGSAGLRPLQLGPSLAKASEGGAESSEWARRSLKEGLAEQLQTLSGTRVGDGVLGKLCDQAVAAMSAGIGVDFAAQVGLLPCFLQPLFVLSIAGALCGAALEARVLVYGYVASKQEHVVGDRGPDSKYTPWCACLGSPDLLACASEVGAGWDWEYGVHEVRAKTIRRAVEHEVPRPWGVEASGMPMGLL